MYGPVQSSAKSAELAMHSGEPVGWNVKYDA